MGTPLPAHASLARRLRWLVVSLVFFFPPAAALIVRL